MAFDVELSLSGEHFILAHSTFFSGIRVRVLHHRQEIIMSLPPVIGEITVLNDGPALVRVKRGETIATVQPNKLATFEVDDNEATDETNLIQIG